MKIIELLNKIANGEEVPKKIKYKNAIFTLRDDKDDYTSGDNWFTDSYDYLELNDEVEIIEEDKKIRKLDFIEENTFSKRQNGMTSEDRRLLDSNFKEIGNKINEIIDYLEEKE